jgi:hypothetical protein
VGLLRGTWLVDFDGDVINLLANVLDRGSDFLGDFLIL